MRGKYRKMFGSFRMRCNGMASSGVNARNVNLGVVMVGMGILSVIVSLYSFYGFLAILCKGIFPPS